MTFLDSGFLQTSRIISTIFIKRIFPYNIRRYIHMEIRHDTKSAMEIAKVSPLVTAFRQAVQTFDVKNKSELSTNLIKLKNLMDILKLEDFNFDEKLIDPSNWKNVKKAPCSYIEVFQNNQINMSIFILKPGFRMPLHDHPHMHGLLKVIAGAVQIRSFTEYPLKESVNALEFQIAAKQEANRLHEGIHKKRILYAKISNDRVCSETTETCVLTPTVSNYHEIEALNLPAAFFDILSPPYDTLIENIGPTRCRYYKVTETLSNNLVKMQEVDDPDCFYCDHAPYLGPVLN